MKNAQPQPPGALAALRNTLNQAEELIREGLISLAALRLAQLATEAGEVCSELGAAALNIINQPADGGLADRRIVVPQHPLGHVVSHHAESLDRGREVIHPEIAAS